MPENAKTVRLKGLSRLGYFPTVVDTPTEYSATGPRVALESANTCNKTDNKTTTNIPADDNPAWDSESEWEDTTLTFTVRGMLLEDLAVLQGSTLKSGGKGMLETIYDEAPTVALNFAALQAGGGYRCFTYYAAKLQSAQVNHQTKSNSTNLQDYTLEFRCKGRALDGAPRDVEEVEDGAAADAWLASVAAATAPTGG